MKLPHIPYGIKFNLVLCALIGLVAGMAIVITLAILTGKFLEI